jgi:hypothetical protein
LTIFSPKIDRSPRNSPRYFDKVWIELIVCTEMVEMF